MPPANSPDREPTPFTSALRGLESPVHDDVLNLAATLTAGDGDGDMDGGLEDDVNESRTRLRQLERTRDDVDHRDRLRRSMDRLNRLHEASAQAQHARTLHVQQLRSRALAGPAAPYGEQIPSQNSLSDWAPHASALDAAENPYADGTDLERRSLRSTAILQAVRRHPRFPARTREYLQRFTYDRERETDSDREREREPATETATATETASLRRSIQDPWGGPRERYQASSVPPTAQPPTVAPMLEHTVKYLSRIRHASSVDESLHCALDAGFLTKDSFCIQYADFLTDTCAIPPPQDTSWLAPGAVLSGYQHATTSPSTSASTSTSTSAPHLATSQLPPPSRPWLSTSYSTPRSLTSYLSPDVPPRAEPTQPPRAEPTQPPPQQDRWPVKVTVHAVDWSEMSLSATMEAYNVPSHPHQTPLNNPSTNAQYTRTSSITTYLEGEILDFNTHTLLTESFKSSAANDALYWRKLPPFRDMPDEDVARALTSRRWWEALNRDWILMRWKERCFVKSMTSRRDSKTGSRPAPAPDSFTPRPPPEEAFYTHDHEFAAPDEHRWPDAEHAAFDDSGCGLTISGFYYVCLRREDGRVEGLYYDPMSSPYQCLVLESRARGRFASWAFK